MLRCFDYAQQPRNYINRFARNLTNCHKSCRYSFERFVCFCFISVRRTLRVILFIGCNRNDIHYACFDFAQQPKEYNRSQLVPERSRRDSNKMLRFFSASTALSKPNKYKQKGRLSPTFSLMCYCDYSLTGITSIAFLSLLRVSSLPRISVMSNMCGPLDSPTSASLRGFITAPMP